MSEPVQGELFIHSYLYIVWIYLFSTYSKSQKRRARERVFSNIISQGIVKSDSFMRFYNYRAYWLVCVCAVYTIHAARGK